MASEIRFKHWVVRQFDGSYYGAIETENVVVHIGRKFSLSTTGASRKAVLTDLVSKVETALFEINAVYNEAIALLVVEQNA